MVKEKDNIIIGWKAICAYLEWSMNTVKKYARECGFPLHKSSSNGMVYIDKKEVIEWLCKQDYKNPTG